MSSFTVVLSLILAIALSGNASALVDAPSSVYFGGVLVGGVAYQELVITNLNDTPLNFGSPAVTGTNTVEFTVGPGCGTVQPLQTCVIPLTYVPRQKNNGVIVKLALSSDDPDSPLLNVSLQANAYADEEGALFKPAESIDTGSWPEAVAIGDVNGDGRNDVVMTTSYYFSEENDYKLFVFLQGEDGKLLPPVKYPTSSSYTSRSLSVAIADLNHDGKPDVVVGNTNNIEVFLQDADGKLSPPVQYTTQNGAAIAVGDFNNDGLIDVACLGAKRDSIHLFLQNAGGTLDGPVSYELTISNTAGAVEIAAGDVNGDGLTDVIIDGVTVLLQQPDGTLGLPATYSLGSTGHSSGIAVGDVNGDGKQDIIQVIPWGSAPSVLGAFYQQEAGGFHTSVYPFENSGNSAVKIADVDKDGKNDVVVLHGGTKLSIYQQDAKSDLVVSETFSMPYATHYQPYALAVGDFNGDGWPDIATANYNYGLVVLYNRDPSRRVVVEPGEINFGTLKAGTTAAHSFTLRNVGSKDVVLDQITFTERNSTAFTVRNDGCSGATLSPEATCLFNVEYTAMPTNNSTHTASLSFPARGISVRVSGGSIASKFIVRAFPADRGSLSCSSRISDYPPYAFTAGEDVTCTANPYLNFHSVGLTVDGVPTTGDSYTFYALSANHGIAAHFAYNISATAGTGGTITRTGPDYAPVYSFIPQAGYTVADVKLDGVSLGPVLSRSFSSSEVSSVHTLEATFSPAIAASSFAYIPNSGEDSVSVVDKVTARVVAVIRVAGTTYPAIVTITPDGRKVYIGGSNDTISVIDTKSNTVIGTIAACTSPSYLLPTNDGRNIYVACTNDNVTVIDTKTDEVTLSQMLWGGVSGLAFSPDGTVLYVGQFLDNTVSFFDAKTLSFIDSVTVGKNPYTMLVSVDGKRLYVARYGGRTISVIDTDRRKVVKNIIVGKNPLGMAMTPGGTQLYVSVVSLNKVAVIDTLKNRVVRYLKVGMSPTGVSVDSSGQIYVVNSGSETLSIIDPMTGRTQITRVGVYPFAIGRFAGPDILGISAPGLLDFGSMRLHGAPTEKPLSIANYGNTEVRMLPLTLAGNDAAFFSIASGTCGSLTPTLPPGGSCSITVVFNPAAIGAKTASIDIISDDLSISPSTVNLAAQVRR